MNKTAKKLLKIGNRAIKKAQENNRKKGIPNVYSINGKIIFQLPNGDITTQYNFSQKSFVIHKIKCVRMIRKP